MRFPIIVGTLFLALYALDLLLLVACNRRWWHRPWVRRSTPWVPLLALGFGGLWALGAHFDLRPAATAGAALLSALYLYLAGLLVALLITAPLHTGEKLYDLLRYRLLGRTPPPSPSRRRFLRRALAAVPLLSASGVTYGLVRSNSEPRLPQIPLHYAHLPAGLEGLRILQLSDIHIGPYIDLDDLERLLERAGALRPDLVLLTGDVCDYLPSYADALRLVEGLQAPLGTFASLGNHEYFRGIHAVRRRFDQSAISLLVNGGLSIEAGSSTLYIAGADDPRYLSSPESFKDLQRFVDRAVDQAPEHAFKILMSHRPQGFDYAAPMGIELTLAGHTHGFQIGLGGRSLAEPFMPERYVWGHYQRDASQLYTTAGVGHWFPFRLGCPPEAPLFTLHRA